MGSLSALEEAKPHGAEVEVVVVVVPLVAQGHLNAFLHLSRHLAIRGIPVHYVSSSTHIRQAKDRVNGWNPTSVAGIHFHPFPLPPFATPPPDPRSIIKFPSHLQPAFEAALLLETPLTSLLRSLSSSARRLVLIHDSAMSFAANAAASLPNVETYAFHTVSAITNVFFQWKSRGMPSEPWMESFKHLPDVSFDGCFSDEFMQFIQRQHALTTAASGRIINTCAAIEGIFIDRLRQEPRWHGQKIFAVGPLNPLIMDGERSGSYQRHECLEWLDQQPPASVLYVSFGTTTFFSAKQTEELAAGLHNSGQRYLWVNRDADRGDIYANDSEYRDSEARGKVRGAGMVVRRWAPQMEILSHPSTGAFFSHCGWNSCMESLSMGVPILAWPMHSDQPSNAVLVFDYLGVGMLVRDWNRRNEMLMAEEVKDSVVRMMVGEEAGRMRQRAKAVSDDIRRAALEDDAELGSFVSHIARGEHDR